MGLLAVLLLALVAAGCKEGKANADGGDASVPPMGLEAFDVVAVLSGGTGQLPATNSFTLVLDREAGRAIVGGNGRGAVIVATRGDGGSSFHLGAGAAVGSAGGGSCAQLDSVEYQAMDVSIVNGALTGTATGTANISRGDSGQSVAFTATLAGSADATPPRVFGIGPSPSTPFDSFGLVASEPLPASATARLVASDGVTIDLVPTRVEGSVPLITRFTKPEVVLAAGRGYTVSLDGLVDFAGLSGPADQPLRFVSFPAAPVVPEDGFESAMGTELGGALVMTNGPLPAIAGNKSLYVGTPTAPAIQSVSSRSLMVRLSREPTDTKLSLSYRGVSAEIDGFPFSGWVQIGSIGAVGTERYLSQSDGPKETLTLASGQAFLTAPATLELELPSDTTSEVLVAIGANNFSCTPFRVNAGLLIDDLRLE